MSNAIDIEIFRHLFASVAEEMGSVLMRTALSTNIKERLDYSCAIFDAGGQMLAQAAHIPVHLGATPRSVEAAIASIDMRPGMHIALNDPFCGGSHLPDITVVSPVFIAGCNQPCFYVANRAHHSDIGGSRPGSMPLSTSIEDEGFRFGPTAIDSTFVGDLRANVRLPDEREGDLRAQLAANHTGVGRLEELTTQHGIETLSRHACNLIDYTERVMRAVIAQIPNGEYRFTDYLDSDGQGQQNIAICVVITIDGDHATADFSGTSKPVMGCFNCPKAVTESAVYYCFRCLAPNDMPTNAGYFRCLTVRTDPISLVNARYPAAVAGGNVETSQRIVDVVLGALAGALPGRIPAASHGSMNNVVIGSTAEGFSYYETIGGGSGAGPSGTGADAIQTHMTNTLNTPIEILEQRYRLLITDYRILDHSGGAGRYRGGNGIRRRYRFLDDCEVTLLTERRRRAPWGQAGGRPGHCGKNWLISASGSRRELPEKIQFTARRNEELVVETAGGGGYGSVDESD